MTYFGIKSCLEDMSENEKIDLKKKDLIIEELMNKYNEVKVLNDSLYHTMKKHGLSDMTTEHFVLNK